MEGGVDGAGGNKGGREIARKTEVYATFAVWGGEAFDDAEEMAWWLRRSVLGGGRFKCRGAGVHGICVC